MGTVLHGKNRKNGNLSLNSYGMESLRFLCNGLKRKYGIYAPLTQADCKIAARILTNKAMYFQILQKDDPHHHTQKAFNNYFRYGKKIDYMTDSQTINWILDVAKWFENCGGLIPEPGNKHYCDDCEHYWDGFCDLNECMYKDFGEHEPSTKRR